MKNQSGSGSKYQMCSRCIMDNRVKGISFDLNGECNFCKIHDRLDKIFPLNEKGQRKLEGIVNKIKRKGKNNESDCIIGVSGGADSIYTLWLAKKHWNLNPLALHYDDGFRNPVAIENLKRATEKLNIDLITVKPDIKESNDFKLAFLKASTPDLDAGTEFGIASALYAVATQKNIKYILVGHSFRTEGIAPISWGYLDGKYFKDVHKIFGEFTMKKWKPAEPGFSLDIPQIIYYSIIKNIKVIPILFYIDYNKQEAKKIIQNELKWTDMGAHYFDDLYQSLIAYIHRVKFNIDRRLFNYSALIRSNQMTRNEALEKKQEVNNLEDKITIDNCINILGITRDEFEGYIMKPAKTFQNYSTNYNLIRKLRIFVKTFCHFNILPASTYEKYFNSGSV